MSPTWPFSATSPPSLLVHPTLAKPSEPATTKRSPLGEMSKVAMPPCVRSGVPTDELDGKWTGVGAIASLSQLTLSSVCV